MKKLLLLFLLISFTLILPLNTLAIEPTGPLTNSEEGFEWFDKYRAEARVDVLLQGNTAFVANSDKVWHKDKQQTIAEKCYMDEHDNFYIPSEAALEFFGVKSSSKYITAKELKEKARLNMYFDPLGLVLLSKSGSNIPATVEWNTVCDAMGEISWQYVDFTKEEQEAYIRKWQKLMLAPSDGSEETETYISSVVNSAETIRSRLYYDGVQGPFSDIILATDNINTSTYLGNLSTCYTRLLSFAKSYAITGRNDTKMRDEILRALEYLYEFHYSLEQDPISKSWTYEQFTIPYNYSAILCLMYDDMTDEDRIRHTNAIFDRHPDPSLRRGVNSTIETYTNRIWRTFSYFNTAMIANDVERMNYAMQYVSQAFGYAITGYEDRNYETDGFYEDGSMIFHKGIPYNMAYGANYVMGNSIQLLCSEGTAFDIRKLTNWNNIYNFIIDSYLPFIESNTRMRMVIGREAPNGVSGAMIHVCNIMNNAPEPYKTQMAKAIKTAVSDSWEDYEKLDSTSDYYGISGYYLIQELKKAIEFINSININDVQNVYSKIYYNMDRIVHRMPTFTAGLAMSSQRIQKLEAYGSEKNGNGWYTGDGMLYIYNGDGIQHQSAYTTKSNPYHIPGTTVDSTERDENFDSANAMDWGYPDNLWAGGVTNGKVTMATYEIGNKYVSPLKGRKSYFMLEDKVVCLGSGISGGNGNVYTTVENFMITEKADTTQLENITIPIVGVTSSLDPKTVITEHATFDKDDTTLHATNEMGAWLCYDLGEVRKISGLALAFPNGASRNDKFRVEVSSDNVNFTPVLESMGNGKGTGLQFFPIDASARYIRYVFLQNNKSQWCSISEINVIKENVSEEMMDKLFTSITNGYEDFYIDGNKIETEFNSEKVYNNPSYAWLENAGGYVFSKNSNLSCNRETYGINVQPFMSLWLNHGVAPKDETYEYVIMPKATMEQTKEFAANPTVEVLSNTPKLHLVQDKESKIWAASVFAVGKVMDINVKTPCLIMCDTAEKTIYVSDATHRFNKITLVLPKGMKASKTDGITVKGQTVIIDISAQKGATYSFSYTK